MAKLVETLEGYNPDMTPEEKLALLEGYELPDPDPTPATPPPAEPPKPAPKPDPKPGYVPKTAFDKTASELAALKRQLRSKMTEEEQRAEEAKAQQEAIQAELESLRKEKTVASHRAELLNMGYDGDLAAMVAQALADGDTDGLFAGMKKFTDAYTKKITADVLKNTPRPAPSEAEAATQKAEQNKMRAAMGLPPI